MSTHSLPMQNAKIVRLTNTHGMQVTLMDWGATWLSCLVPLGQSVRREVLLGCATPEDYAIQKSYLGATVGRYANRIAKGHLPYPGGDRQLLPNQGENQLHGGPDGWHRRRWDIRDQDGQRVVFTLTSADGDQGYPGQVEASVTYELFDDNSLLIEFHAQTDQLTPLNLTNHAYFNLDGAGAQDPIQDVRGHSLQIPADLMLPTDGMGIPFGDLRPVAGSSFDFRERKPLARDFLSDEQQTLAKGYDHSFLLDPNAKIAAEVHSADGQVVLQIDTSLPAIQLYSGNYLAGTPARHGGAYADYAALALEPQFLPDSPHHPEWPQPSCWLEPGQTFHHHIRYRFGKA